MEKSEREGTVVHIPEPLKLEDLEALWPALDDIKAACETARRKGTCLAFDCFLKLNPNLTKINMRVNREYERGRGLYDSLIVSLEFNEEEGSSFYEEDDWELCEEIESIFAGLERYVSRVFAGAEKMEVQQAAREVGKALIGQDYEAWMSRRVAAALNKEVPVCAASVAALRM